MQTTYLTELASQIFASIQNTIKIISEFIGFKKKWESSFTRIIQLQAKDFELGYVVENETVVEEKDGEETVEEARLYILDLVNNSLEAITGADEKLRQQFENHLAEFLDWIEIGMKPKALKEKRRVLRFWWIKALGNDRAKYDQRLMKQMDLIISLAEGVGFKARVDLREEFDQRHIDEDEE
jgi:hypothetical protein